MTLNSLINSNILNCLMVETTDFNITLESLRKTYLLVSTTKQMPP